LTAAPALAFEGEIDAKTFGDTSGNDTEFAIYVSDKRDVRMDATAKSRRGKARRVSFIKPAKGKYDFMIDHDKKKAVKVTKESVIASMKTQPSHEQATKDNIEVKQLGAATVAGQPTRHVQVIDKDNGEVSDLWFSDRYPPTMWQNVFSFDANAEQSPTGQWARVAERKYGVKPGFIMKMMLTDKSGAKSGLEITRMQEKKVAANKFTIPSGYEVTTMPDMPAGAPMMGRPTTKEEAEQMRDEWLKKMQEDQKR
jgi:hypothetical protein